MNYNPNKTKYDVLIVDDIPENIQILASILTQHNVDVSFAINGIQALQTIKFNPPDLILLDVSMPVMDGFEICTQLQANEKTKDIPVIFLTARSQKEDIIKGFEVGAVDYITKPFNSKELLSRVFSHLRLKKAQDIINKQNIQLSKKNEQITKSIQYAKAIQEALLPDVSKINTILKDYFIFYEPKDIVSGDFYWVTKQNNKTIIAVVDSTGHGVPGAFMSIIGINLLNEIIIDNEIFEPLSILQELNKGINKALHTRDDDISFHHDGMEASICLIDENSKKIKISSTTQTVYYAKNNKINTIEGDIYSIGGLLSLGNKIDFKMHEFDFNEIDIIYLFSDGYQDQFGGKENKKLMVGRYKEIISDICSENMTKQKEILDKEFNDWKGNKSQVDDVLIFGIKL
jgi:phosphoserine phosphatase RsbU/P